MAQGPGVPADWRRDMECPHCGAPITSINETQCPYCHEVLPAAAVAVKERAVVETNKWWLLGIGVVMLFCCWPVGALIIMLVPKWRPRIRVAIVLGSLALWVVGCTPYWIDYSRSCTSNGAGNLSCGSSSPTPTPYRVR